MKMMNILKKDKRGVLGLDTATSFALALMTLAVIGFAFVIALNALQDADIAAAGSVQHNQTVAILQNSTEGVSTLFANATTWFSLIAIVIIILIISVVIVSVRSFRRGGET